MANLVLCLTHAIRARSKTHPTSPMGFRTRNEADCRYPRRRTLPRPRHGSWVCQCRSLKSAAYLRWEEFWGVGSIASCKTNSAFIKLCPLSLHRCRKLSGNTFLPEATACFLLRASARCVGSRGRDRRRCDCRGGSTSSRGHFAASPISGAPPRLLSRVRERTTCSHQLPRNSRSWRLDCDRVTPIIAPLADRHRENGSEP